MLPPTQINKYSANGKNKSYPFHAFYLPNIIQMRPSLLILLLILGTCICKSSSPPILKRIEAINPKHPLLLAGADCDLDEIEKEINTYPSSDALFIREKWEEKSKYICYQRSMIDSLLFSYAHKYPDFSPDFNKWIAQSLLFNRFYTPSVLVKLDYLQVHGSWEEKFKYSVEIYQTLKHNTEVLKKIDEVYQQYLNTLDSLNRIELYADAYQLYTLKESQIKHTHHLHKEKDRERLALQRAHQGIFNSYYQVASKSFNQKQYQLSEKYALLAYRYHLDYNYFLDPTLDGSNLLIKIINTYKKAIYLSDEEEAEYFRNKINYLKETINYQEAPLEITVHPTASSPILAEYKNTEHTAQPTPQEDFKEIHQTVTTAPTKQTSTKKDHERISTIPNESSSVKEDLKFFETPPLNKTVHKVRDAKSKEFAANTLSHDPSTSINNKQTFDTKFKNSTSDTGYTLKDSINKSRQSTTKPRKDQRKNANFQQQKRYENYIEQATYLSSLRKYDSAFEQMMLARKMEENLIFNSSLPLQKYNETASLCIEQYLNKAHYWTWNKNKKKADSLYKVALAIALSSNTRNLIEVEYLFANYLNEHANVICTQNRNEVEFLIVSAKNKALVGMFTEAVLLLNEASNYISNSNCPFDTSSLFLLKKEYLRIAYYYTLKKDADKLLQQKDSLAYITTYEKAGEYHTQQKLDSLKIQYIPLKDKWVFEKNYKFMFVMAKHQIAQKNYTYANEILNLIPTPMYKKEIKSLRKIIKKQYN